jgi:hypothetical protein
MKTIGSVRSGLVALGLALAMVLPVSAQQDQGSAKVVSIRGNARYKTATATDWQPLRVGTILRSGTLIQTAKESHVDLVLNNPGAVGALSTSVSQVSYAPPRTEQDAIRVFENTVLGIDKLSVVQTGADKVTDTQLDLKAGKIFGSVKRMSAASNYEIKIPNGIAGIRGTIYTISADGVLSVVSGSVVLAYMGADGQPVTQVVGAGQQFDMRTGQLTTIPEGIMTTLERIVRELQLTGFVPPTVFVVDSTVYHVSPTTEGGFGGF